jgi:hypothetical protein
MELTITSDSFQTEEQLSSNVQVGKKTKAQHGLISHGGAAVVVAFLLSGSTGKTSDFSHWIKMV